jgi:plasmid maintenance system antidote protein VapI
MFISKRVKKHFVKNLLLQMSVGLMYIAAEKNIKMGSNRNNHSETIHLGQIIREKVKRSGMSITEFAEKINLSRPAVYQLFEKKSIDCEMIRKISILLGENLFCDIYNEVQKTLPENISKQSIFPNFPDGDELMKLHYDMMMLMEKYHQELLVIKDILTEIKVELKERKSK